MSEKLIVSWEEYNSTVEKLAIMVHESDYKPTLLVGIMRGGAPMIDLLSRVFKLKCAYLAVESYSGKGVEDEQGNIVFSREMSSIAKNMGGKILLCDDLSDTGITLNKSVDWLRKYKPIKGKIEDIKTATLWKKKKSTFEPDFCAVRLPDNPWIVQPFEHYEEIRIEGNDFPRTVIWEFPTYEVAEKCYNSQEYQKAWSLAKSSTERNLQIVEGV